MIKFQKSVPLCVLKGRCRTFFSPDRPTTQFLPIKTAELGAPADACAPAGIATFGSTNDGRLSLPQDIAFGPDGELYVTSYLNNKVIRYDGSTGVYIDDFASVSRPVNIEFVPEPIAVGLLAGGPLLLSRKRR